MNIINKEKLINIILNLNKNNKKTNKTDVLYVINYINKYNNDNKNNLDVITYNNINNIIFLIESPLFVKYNYTEDKLLYDITKYINAILDKLWS